jgi:hypothetical protein
MVKIIIMMLSLSAATAYAITPDELRALSADKDREDTQRSNRANTGAVDTLLPNKNMKPPASFKYSSGSNNETAASTDRPATKTIKRQGRSVPKTESGAAASSNSSSDPDVYIPPARQNSTAQAGIVSDAIPATLVFGIRLGTWMPATLSRDTSSAEPGTVELTIAEDIIGDRRTLPVGSVVFAIKTLNSSTKRMEMSVTHGITPAGHEFKLRGIIFDPLKVSGLTGIYTVDEKAIATHGLQKGTVAGIGAATQSMGAINPLIAAGGAATQSVLSDTGGAVAYNAPTAVIYVSPQPLIIRVEERF